MKTSKLLKEIKGVFKPPQKKYYFGRLKFGTPYFWPMYFNPTIFSIRKLKVKTQEQINKEKEDYPHKHTIEKFSNLPMVRRNKDCIFKLFGNYYFLSYGWPIAIHRNTLGWKDKYSCYDEKTEVLTKNGWKSFKDISYTDELACLNNKGFAEYHKPKHITSEHYSGEMYHLQSTGVDILVTPNHNLYVARGNKYGRYPDSGNKKKSNFELCSPFKYFNKPKRFLKSFLWEGEKINTIIIPGYSYTKGGNKKGVINNYTIKDQIFDANTFLKFLGFFVAEGCANEKKGEVFITCCNDGSEKAKNEQIDFEKVLTSLGITIKVTHKERTALGYKIYDKALSKWLVNNCGKLAQNKKVPPLIKSLCSEQINLFLQWLYRGDGHKAKTSHTLTTVSKQLKDDVEELILKGGKTFKTSLVKSKGKKFIIDGREATSNYDCYNVNWLQKRNTISIHPNTIKNNRVIEEWSYYDGKVYCATVPYNKLFIKRGGKGVWCGNSPRYEWSPAFKIYFFGLQFCIFYVAPQIEGEERCQDLYWEMILWYLHYCDKDIKKAQESWGWVNYDTKQSTWNTKYLE